MMVRLSHGIYSIGAHVAARGASWWMRRKKRWNDESVAQRYGRQLPPPPYRRPIWIHAASMGEVRVGAALAHTLSSRGATILGTAMTETGFNLLRAAYPAGSVATRAPFDLKRPVSAVFDQYNPTALVLVETELWPNMLAQAKARTVPVFIANGRLSDRAFPKYRLTRWFWRDLLAGVVRFYMRSQTDAERMIQLGIDPSRVEVGGSLKSATIPPMSDRTRSMVGRIASPDTPVWLAGSTRPGEEVEILSAHKQLLAQFPGLQLWIAPRHPQRFEEVAALLKGSGLEYRRWSELNDSSTTEKPRILLVDQMGILPELYVRAQIAFVGGSLKPFGGHNPMEPALCGTPVIFGPCMDTQRENADWLTREHLATVVQDSNDIVAEVTRVLEITDSVADRERRIALVRSLTAGTVERIADDIMRRIGESGAS